MKRRTLLAFIILNILVSVAVTFTVATVLDNGRPQPTPIIPPTVVVFITNTPGPTQTPIVQIITATPDPKTLTESGDNGALGDLTEEATEGPTETPTLTEAELTATEAAINELQTHTVQAGESPALIAANYEVSVEDLLCQNGLEEGDLIFPDDVLVIPGPEGCTYSPATETAAPGEPDAPDATSTRSPLPTITLQPTAENAQLRVDAVIGAGDITVEEVTLINDGGFIDLTGWKLYDREGNEYTFPETRIFPGGAMTVRTRRGEDTPLVRYWGLNTAVWGDEGDAVTLEDAEGAVQAIYVIGEEGSGASGATPTPEEP